MRFTESGKIHKELWFSSLNRHYYIRNEMDMVYLSNCEHWRALTDESTTP